MTIDRTARTTIERTEGTATETIEGMKEEIIEETIEGMTTERTTGTTDERIEGTIEKAAQLGSMTDRKQIGQGKVILPIMKATEVCLFVKTKIFAK